MPLGPGPGGQLPQTPGGGGTEAPATGRGRRPNPPGRGMMNPPGQGNPPQRRGQGQGQPQGKGQGQGKAGVGGAALPGPGGRQLAAKVASGAITQEKAQQTMQQRQTLAKALGPDWREKLSVGGQSFAEVNKGLKANPKDPKLAAIRKKLLANRSSVLETARAKNKGAGKGKGKKGAGEGEE